MVICQGFAELSHKKGDNVTLDPMGNDQRWCDVTCQKSIRSFTPKWTSLATLTRNHFRAQSSKSSRTLGQEVATSLGSRSWEQGCFTISIYSKLSCRWSISGVGRLVNSWGNCMARRKRILTYPILVTMAQVIVCAAGMLGGLTIGAVIIFVSGMWDALDRVLIAPTEAMSLIDLGLAFVTVAIVVVCGWFGIRLGMVLAQNIG